MKVEEWDDRMVKHGIRPTANRELVMKDISEAGKPVSLTDIEDSLETIDKSTIYRILCLFVEHGLLHVIDDGSGSVKYELCMADDECSVDDMHPHFYCVSCHKTLCIKDMKIPVIDLPDGYIIKSVNYVVKGICDECMRKTS